MNRTKVILSIFLMLFLLLAGLVLPSFWKSQKKEASGNKGREPAKETTETNTQDLTKSHAWTSREVASSGGRT